MKRREFFGATGVAGAILSYLVICTVRSHFVDDSMWGWVRVLP